MKPSEISRGGEGVQQNKGGGGCCRNKRGVAPSFPPLVKTLESIYMYMYYIVPTDKAANNVIVVS